MKPLQDPVISEFWKLVAPLRKEILKAYLFGSRAQGKALPDADYDVLVVVPKRRKEILDPLYDAVIKVLLDQEHYISLKVFAKDTFDRLARIPTPFMEEVTQRGIPIE